MSNGDSRGAYNTAYLHTLATTKSKRLHFTNLLWVLALDRGKNQFYAIDYRFSDCNRLQFSVIIIITIDLHLLYKVWNG